MLLNLHKKSWLEELTLQVSVGVVVDLAVTLPSFTLVVGVRATRSLSDAVQRGSGRGGGLRLGSLVGCVRKEVHCLGRRVPQILCGNVFAL